ncbi:MAG: FAD-dependent oxidoreductase [Planctomycetota bacterium]
MLLLSALASLALQAPSVDADVVVLGGTSAGVIASVQVARSGRSVLLVDPDGRLGGLSSGGLGATDVGSAAAIGGLARAFYLRVARHYAGADAWRQEPAPADRSVDAPRWRFEPHVAESIFEDLVAEHDVQVWRGERLDRGPDGLEVRDGRIVSLRTASGRVARGDVFVDATYEGDLMALAGVSHVVGREGEDEFGESLAGVRTSLAVHHQLVPGVDPYRTPGDPESGLLAGIDPTGPGAEGAGDGRIQAYCLRMCLTDVPENRRVVARPPGYRKGDYELLLRNFEAGADRLPWHSVAMPNRKTDTNNNRGVSTDLIGGNRGWHSASYEERARIHARHRDWQRGLLWTLARHPRVPEPIRREAARWGPALDEFVETDGWSPQLYVREARRMRSELVMTEHHCRGTRVAPNPVGLAAYTMDSHHVQRYVAPDGSVRNEGDVQVRVPRPYPIGFAAIRPRRAECTNLLVVCCPSVTHVAFGSIRMEPVFMVLGQSAATAACLAVEGNVAVQDIDLEALDDRLLRGGQVLAFDPAPSDLVAPRPPAGIDPSGIEGLVLDDAAATRVGFDLESRSVGPWIGASYRHDGDAAKGTQRASFRFDVPRAGEYDVFVSWTAHENRASAVPVDVHHADGVTRVAVDQRSAPADAPLGRIGRWRFEEGEARVVVSNEGTDGYVVVDAAVLRP